MRCLERPSECPKVLLVEGNQDLTTVKALMKANGILWHDNPRKDPVWIEQCGGQTELIQSDVIYTELNRSGLESLGIITDADSDLSERWQEVRNACSLSIPDIPESLPEDGLIHDCASIKVRLGVWVMPNNQTLGMLETFLANLLPEGNEPLWSYAQEVVMESKNRNAPFSPNHFDKARIYTWLAWQKPPGCSFREAIQKAVLNPTHPKARKFVNWFKTLYDLP